MTDVVLRAATKTDAEAIHRLVLAHVAEGRLLPRELRELRAHAKRFVVADVAGDVVACAELAPLSPVVAEVRSLVVARPYRSRGLASRLVNELRHHALMAGFDTLAAFTHDTRLFSREGFSQTRLAQVPEKVMTDCVTCPLFGHCDQHAMVLPLDAVEHQQPAPAYAELQIT